VRLISEVGLADLNDEDGQRMKKLLLAAASLLAVAGPITLAASPAEAANPTPGCVTRAEYSMVMLPRHNRWGDYIPGSSRGQVRRIFGTDGRTSYLGPWTSGNQRGMQRRYPVCHSGFPGRVATLGFHTHPGELWTVSAKFPFYP